MMRHDLPEGNWRKSSYSADTNGQCIEYQPVGADSIAVGDSKNRAQGAFVFPVTSWTAFVEAAKAGEFHQ
ncbi:hypothetical protein GCM10012285_41850 [Streptomyces kronopolitis]|uniref:DUF397 domain-containing protein n=1 Tax=Streptomyces kronopolitis TaxID=1612435 RepID=A0ABQ2JRX1_9ACTN|nr:DUF397 domain-containing protein [Streptomyces kronopolitis]GGN51588.1 hypothetical protein GCM10012285_41850 [Streptomyces kronopolitis]